MKQTFNARLLVEQSRQAFWTHETMQKRKDLISALKKRINRSYEEISRFFEKRNANINGFSIDDFLITGNSEIIEPYLQKIQIKSPTIQMELIR